ncbi:MAG: diadenylate cyclase CdaA [Planctomycetes bacterium]|nr:diadenylate cyclase CdaA [Planctomycetota bacterium]
MYQERLRELITRIEGYPLHEVVVELALLWIVVYLVVRFLRGTRGARVIQGMAMILIIATPTIKLLSGENQFERLQFLYSQFVAFAAITLVVVFQPELRRALVRLGEARLFKSASAQKEGVIDEIVAATAHLSQKRIGSLIAIEGEVPLQGIVEAGTPIEGRVTRELLTTIFWPNTALHDMAVVIRGDVLSAAGVQLPLAEGEFSAELGSRHRAALGLSQESDAQVVVVSEETGIISLARRGRLERNLTPAQLKAMLLRGAPPADEATSQPESKSDAPPAPRPRSATP